MRLDLPESALLVSSLDSDLSADDGTSFEGSGLGTYLKQEIFMI